MVETNEHLLKDTKTILNSLVIPYPNGVSLRVLCNEYYDLEGREIPYRELGFNSLTAFLKSIPDMIKMYGNLQDIHSVTLYPVRNEATNHIIDLVIHQNKNKDKRRPKKPHFSYTPRPHSVHHTYRNRQPVYSPSPRLNLSFNSSRNNRVNPLTYNPRLVHHYPQVSTWSQPSATTSPKKPFLNFSITKPANQIPNGQLSRVDSISQPILNVHSIANRSVHSSVTVQSSSITLPNPLIANIRQMMSKPELEDGFMLFNFEARYRNLFKVPFEYKSFGFKDLSQCLKTLSNVLDLIPTGSSYKVVPLKGVSNDNETNRRATPNISGITTTVSKTALIITTTSTATTFTFVSTTASMTTTSAFKPINSFNNRSALTTQSSSALNIGQNRDKELNKTAPDLDRSSYTPKLVADLSKKFSNFTISKPSDQIIGRPMITTDDSMFSNNSNSFRPINGINSGQSSESSDETEQEETRLPKEIVDNIRVLMADMDGDGLMAFNFDYVYKKMFGQSIDYKKYNYKDRAECLKSLSDVLDLVPQSTGTFKVFPKGVSPKVSQREQSLPKAIISSNGAIPKSGLSNGFSIAPTTTTISRHLPIMSTEPMTALDNPFTPSPDGFRRQSDDDSFYSSASNSPVNGLHNASVNNFRQILDLHENGINVVDFAKEYQKLFNVSFDSRVWGFRHKCAIEMFYSLPKIFAIETNDQGETILHDARFKQFEKHRPETSIDSSAVYKIREISDTIQARIIRLIHMHSPSGLSLSAFLMTYELNYGSLNLAHMRISGVDYLFEVLRYDLPIEVKIVDNNPRVFIKSLEELTEWTVKCCRSQRYVIPIELCETPKCVVKPGDNFQPVILPPNFEPSNNEYVAVFISSAISPAEIFIQFKGADHHSKLEEMMSSLEVYDALPEDEWAVPYQFLCVGLPVVTRFPGDRHWHRARITKLYPNQKRMVSVSFVDYGGITVTDFKNLRLMRKEFLFLPIQALKVSLYGIKPILGEKGGWTVAARDRVLKFSNQNYPLACTLLEYESGVYCVALCDTNTENDIFIHNVLVTERQAIYDDSCVEPTSGMNGQ